MFDTVCKLRNKKLCVCLCVGGRGGEGGGGGLGTRLVILHVYTEVNLGAEHMHTGKFKKTQYNT